MKERIGQANGRVNIRELDNPAEREKNTEG
jgi:hypothetical protein